MAMLRRLCAPRRRTAAAQSPAHATATRKQLDFELTRGSQTPLTHSPPTPGPSSEDQDCAHFLGRA
eukprot:6151405-Prymnesium_polylepis.1